MNNMVYVFGVWDFGKISSNLNFLMFRKFLENGFQKVFVYNADQDEWQYAGVTKQIRYSHAVSLVSLSEVGQYCTDIYT